MDKIIELLEKDARLTAKEIAKMLKIAETEVKKKIKKLEDDHVILKYKAIIDPEKLTRGDKVAALIEIKASPERGTGFDKLAERIYNFSEVQGLYLMSGAYDFLAIVEGDTLKDVAFFVAEKLSVLDHVAGTATHFLLRKYKEDGVVLGKKESIKRLKISP